MKSLLTRLAALPVGGTGGIRPPSHKARTLRSAIMPMPLPEILILPLQPSPHARARPAVAPGDRVLKGQCLTWEDPSSVPIHAPTSGVISAVEPRPVLAGSLIHPVCVILAPDGADRALVPQPLTDWTVATPDTLLAQIQRAGLIGHGGAGYPLIDKLRRARSLGVEWLIVNALECEPYLTADEALLRERAAAVVEGARILQQASGARRCLIAIGDDKPVALGALREAATDNVTIREYAARYPQGDAHLLASRILGRQVSRQDDPVAAGALVCNTGTVHGVWQAVVKGQPALSRIVTVAGEAVLTPKNFEALLGTPVEFLLDLCGVEAERVDRVLWGGALRGTPLPTGGVPITQATTALVAATAAEFPAPPPAQPCIRCGHCADACPVQILPQLLHQAALTGTIQDAQTLSLDACLDCSACDWVCPSHIPLRQSFHDLRTALAADTHRPLRSQAWEPRYEFHRYRTARDEKLRMAGKRVAAAAPPPPPPAFDRDQARKDIAAAVARAKARRAGQLPPGTDDKGPGS